MGQESEKMVWEESVECFMERRKSPLSDKKVWQLMLPLIQQLGEMHQQGQYHGAINGRNVIAECKKIQTCFRLSREQARLLAGTDSIYWIKLQEGAGTEEKEGGRIVIEPGYTPLEYYYGREAKTAAADVYGICAVMYTMLTGEKPIDPLRRFMGETLKKPSEYDNVKISAQYETVLLKGLEIKSEDRFSDAQKLLEASIQAELSGNDSDITAADILEKHKERAAAESESSESAESLYEKGIRHYYGDGARKVYKRAFEYFQQAAEKGHADAQCCLGVCYYLGDGVKKDEEQARKWLVLSAKQDNKAAKNNLLLWFKEEEDAAKTYKPLTEQTNKVNAACKKLLDKYPKEFGFSRKLIHHLELGNQLGYLGHDDTFLKSGKNGFAIMQKGFVVKTLGAASPQTVTYRQFLSAETLREGVPYIYADKQIIMYFTGDAKVRKELLELARTIKSLLLMP